MEHVGTPPPRRSAVEKVGAERILSFAVVCSPATLEPELRQHIPLPKADEAILTGHMGSHQDLLQSYEIISSCWVGTIRCSS